MRKPSVRYLVECVEKVLQQLVKQEHRLPEHFTTQGNVVPL